MSWTEPILDALAAQPGLGYLPGSAPAAEPTAIAALSLLAHGRREAALQAAEALAKMQGDNGAVGIRAGEATPGWPTSLAIVAWSAVGNALCGVPAPLPSDPHSERHRGRSLQSNIDRGLAWLLANRGSSIPRSPDFGHNPELVGWAYAKQTHSWVEPTSFAVLALQAAGQGHAAAAREGIAVLFDRQLPGGGLNYGNTYVLGQLIRPHVQPTGIALLALAGQTDGTDKLAKSIAWLWRSIGSKTTPLSLGWALLGLRAQGVELPQADEWLESVAGRLRLPSAVDQRSTANDGTPTHSAGTPVPATYKQALLALAAKGWPA